MIGRGSPEKDEGRIRLRKGIVPERTGSILGFAYDVVAVLYEVLGDSIPTDVLVALKLKYSPPTKSLTPSRSLTLRDP